MTHPQTKLLPYVAVNLTDENYFRPRYQPHPSRAAQTINGELIEEVEDHTSWPRGNLIKVRWEPNIPIYRELEIKYIYRSVSLYDDRSKHFEMNSFDLLDVMKNRKNDGEWIKGDFIFYKKSGRYGVKLA